MTMPAGTFVAEQTSVPAAAVQSLLSLCCSTCTSAPPPPPDAFLITAADGEWTKDEGVRTAAYHSLAYHRLRHYIVDNSVQDLYRRKLAVICSVVILMGSRLVNAAADGCHVVRASCILILLARSAIRAMILSTALALLYLLLLLSLLILHHRHCHHLREDASSLILVCHTRKSCCIALFLCDSSSFSA